MITKDEIESKAQDFGIGPINVERDYVFGWVLAAIYAETALKNVLILKGGAAFRKGYFEATRYTGDIDFSTREPINPELLKSELNKACSLVEARTGVTFDTDRTLVETKDLIQLKSEPSRQLYAARLYFEDFYGRGDMLISVRMDVTEMDRILLPVQTRQLIHPYSDATDCQAEIRCVKLEELLATKLKCLLQRRRANDLFDYIHAIFVRHDIEVDRPEIVRTFLEKTIFRPDPVAARDLLIGLPFEKFHDPWEKYLVVPRQALIRFEQGLTWFKESMAELFSGYAARNARLAFFPAEYRNPIMDAASSMTLLRMTYDGITRDIEPYSLVYKRRQDGVGQEYFYAYDRTGGRRSGPDIKSFLAKGIEKIDVTDVKFEPRYPVEISKAGEPADKSYFGSPFSNSRTPRARTHQTRAVSRPSGYVYEIQCPYCWKKFQHSTRTTTLRAHKDKYGNRCYGRVGTIVNQSWR